MDHIIMYPKPYSIYLRGTKRSNYTWIRGNVGIMEKKMETTIILGVI